MSLLERYRVSAGGRLCVEGDVGRLSVLLLLALEERRIDACAICEHRLHGDVIEDVGHDESWEGRWTMLRTCTGVTSGNTAGESDSCFLPPRHAAGDKKPA